MSTEITISEIDLEGPAIAEVAITVTNSSTRTMSGLEIDVAGPIGWSVYPEHVKGKGSIHAGASWDTTVQVRIPAKREGFWIREITATAAYRGGDGEGEASATRTEQTGEPLKQLAEAFNNVGVTDESDPAPGDYDGEGNSFSAQQLAGEGAAPGAAISALGVDLTWPEADPGTPGNVACAGQAVTLAGQGSAVVFLGSGVGSSAVGSATVHYTDGTTTSGTFGFPNWTSQEEDAHGATLVLTTMGRNTPEGYANSDRPYRVFAHSVQIDPAKSVDFVVLPATSTMHVFAMALSG